MNHRASNRAQIRMLPDGRRLHMHDGPIDIIVEAFGAASEVEVAYRGAADRFVGILDELCSELQFLRRPARETGDLPSGAIARRMLAAVKPYASQIFITPMAAVAGAVAEEILEALIAAARLSRAYVNDGGDIALHLAPGETFVVGMVERSDRASLFGTTTIKSGDPIRGIATSGWRGRSFSLGIADAVTVLADTAAMADAAATVVANAVDLPGHPRVERVRACELAPDSDLGERLVTQSVEELTPGEIREALEVGIRVAESLCGSGLVRAAALNLQGETRIVVPVETGLAPSPSAATRAGSPVHA
ncbi:MAG TPA: UPF0280 family protein [Gemmatimonadaceae bacterium]|nr:UPF0280 family protein [Gemmatimonadaceae bacterium]